VPGPTTGFEATPVSDGPGTVIGPYRLMEQTGEGGTGLVFVAEQQQPVRRKVALKVIKPGMDSRQVVARFEAERQALALMDHPHIAKEFDGGSTPSGRPYFVMELVRGVPITQSCDDNRLTLRQRLELFVSVCQAVQHAHQKGLIHRDLKPSNVLVVSHDGTPVVKVIDFGVAKAIGPRLTDKTVYTGFHQLIGTPMYTSPEQAGMSGLDIDTRTDIYALGVLLYELLTGTTPFDQQRLHTAAYDELCRIIREEEPPRPSKRLSTLLGERLTAVSAQRQTDPKRLCRLCRGELDWIVMKALEKDRTRRYQTANGFARDIQRYLADEPVEACPPSAVYRLRKFARKHWRGLATAGAFVLLLAAAAVVSTWQAIRAREAQSRAENQFDLAQESERNARQAQEVAQSQRQQAVTNLYHALVEEADALRRARGMGYRTQVFDRLQKALQLDTPDKDTNQLRDEAVACLGDFVGLEPIVFDDFPAPDEKGRGGIQKIALTPDGEQIAIALDNGTIQVRSISTRGEVARLTESARGLGVDPDYQWLVTAGATGTIKVWPHYGVGGAPALRTIDMGADFAGMSSNGKYVVGFSKKDGKLLFVWDVVRQQVKARLNVPSEEPEEPLQVSDDGQWVAQASRGGTKLYALVWNTPIAEPKKIFFAETNQDTQALAISSKGEFLACQHGDDGLILLDVRKAAPRPLIRDHEVQAACFSQDGRYCVYYNGTTKLWNVATHREVAALDHPGTGVGSSATFSADGNVFATADKASHSIRVWKLAGTGEKLVLAGHDNGVPDVRFSPDGKVLASASKDRSVKLWDVATGRLQGTLQGFESSIQSISFSPDGRLLATAQFGPTAQPVQIWNLATHQAIALPDDELGQSGYGVAFSPDGKILAACGDGLTLWRVGEGAGGRQAGVGGHGSGVFHASFERLVHLPGKRSLYLCISPNGRLLAWVDNNLLVCLWDLTSGREIPFITPLLGNGWRGLAFYPDSDHLTFETVGGTVETWDTRTVRWVSSHGHRGSVAAGPDGRWLVTSALWSSTGSRAFALPRERPSWCAAVSPDGQRLAWGMIDGGVEIWSVPRIQAQLARIGLAWREDARPPEQQEPPPFVATTPRQERLQEMQYSDLGKRLAWVGRVREAEDVYRASLKVKPDDPVRHGHFGKFLEDQARYAEAEAEFSEAIKLQPEEGLFRVQRGGAHADMGQWDKASADFFEATQCKPPDPDAWHSRAMLYLRDGNQGGYRDVCSDMLQRFSEEAVWTCTVTPYSGADPARIVSLAEAAIAKSPKGQGYVNQDHWHVNQLGAALYRAGRFEEAIRQLTEATKLGVHPYRSNMLTTWYFLAMAHHRLGHADEARCWHDKAVQGTEEALRSPAEPLGKSGNPNGVIGPNWNRRLTLQLLRREAEQMIQGPGTKPEK
jgi:serine/threonine protein kinase/WD40 repeat protein/tetratricopeptide (TPR) repeat protein